MPIRNKSKFQLFSELQIILLFPEFPGARRAPGCHQSKICTIKKCTHLGPSLTLPIRNKSKFQLFSELQIILLFPEFPGALRAPGCHQSKICKIQKCTHLGPSLTMLFGKKSKFQFLYSIFEIALLFQVFPRALRALRCLQLKSCQMPKCTDLGPSLTLILCKKSEFQLFI